MSKYRRLRQHVVTSDVHAKDVLIVPPAATDQQLLSCHSKTYLTAVQNGTLTTAEIRRIGFPWSEKMVERSRRSTGATIAAARAALSERVSANLAGGTHHAFSDAGEGYCVFNDAAVTIRTLQQEGLVRRACVIDLDVHQGNGTASILRNDESVFTLSVHGVKNFPLRKVESDLDVSLPDGTQDDEYLAALQDALDQVSTSSAERYDLAIYLAGADPFEGDRLGRLAISKAVLRQRDQLVFEWCKKLKLPVAICMAGGYAPKIDDIVEIHASTLRIATSYCQFDANAVS